MNNTNPNNSGSFPFYRFIVGTIALTALGIWLHQAAPDHKTTERPIPKKGTVAAYLNDLVRQLSGAQTKPQMITGLYRYIAVLKAFAAQFDDQDYRIEILLARKALKEILEMEAAPSGSDTGTVFVVAAGKSLSALGNHRPKDRWLPRERQRESDFPEIWSPFPHKRTLINPDGDH